MTFEPRTSRSGPATQACPRGKRAAAVIIAFAVVASAAAAIARSGVCLEEHALVLSEGNQGNSPLSDALTFAPWISLMSEDRIAISLHTGQVERWQVVFVRGE